MEIFYSVVGCLLFMAAMMAWIGYSLEQTKKLLRWSIAFTCISMAFLLYIIVSLNTKNCNEYMIDDYQRGDVPVSCVGTYNTVPDKDRY